MTFQKLVVACASNRELLAELDRLSNTHLSAVSQRSGLDAAIDAASGRDDDACRRFIAFVHDVVWSRLPPEVFGLRADAAMDSPTEAR